MHGASNVSQCAQASEDQSACEVGPDGRDHCACADQPLTVSEDLTSEFLRQRRRRTLEVGEWDELLMQRWPKSARVRVRAHYDPARFDRSSRGAQLPTSADAINLLNLTPNEKLCSFSQ